MGLGFKLPGSPHLSPSLRSSNSHSSASNSNSAHLQHASNSPASSPHLLPRSPALRSSSRQSGPSTLALSSSKNNKHRSPLVTSQSPAMPPKSPAVGPSSSDQQAASALSLSHLPRSSVPKAKPAIKMEFRIESPPLLMIGSHSESTGSLLSGLFTLHVNAPNGVALKSVHIAVIQDVCLNVPNSPVTSTTHGHIHFSKSSQSSSIPNSPALGAVSAASNTTNVKTSTIAPAAPTTAWSDPPHFHHLIPSASLGCTDCLTRTTELARWNVLSAPNVLPKGAHVYPFSHLVPGSVPASCYNPVFTVRYRLVAIAIPDSQPGTVPSSPLMTSIGPPMLDPAPSTAHPPKSPATLLPKSPSSLLAKSPLLLPKSSSKRVPSMNPLSPAVQPATGSSIVSPSSSVPGTPKISPVSLEPYVHEVPLNVKRAIVRGPDRNSIRVFPPTDFVAHLTMPSVAYPESNFTLELVLEGVNMCSENAGRKTRWRMRKINWRIDEACKYVVARCPAHIHEKIPRKGRTISNSAKTSRSNSIAEGGTQTAAINSGGFTNAGGTTTGYAGPVVENPQRGSRHNRSATTSPRLGPFSHGLSSLTPAAQPSITLPLPAVTVSRPSSFVGATSSVPSTPASSSSTVNRPGYGNAPAALSQLHLPSGSQHASHSPVVSPRIGPISNFSSLGNLLDDESAVVSEPNSAQPSPSLHPTTNGNSSRSNDAGHEDEENRDNSNSNELDDVVREAAEGPQGPLPGDRPGDVTIEHTRIIGMGEMKTGFKTDFSGKGKVEAMAEIDTHSFNHVSCNLADPDFGMAINHTLVVEMVVAEEITPSKGHYQPIATGAARVLRMQFGLNLTERPGLGIAWDDEVPPMYADVPTSPPQYEQVAGQLSIEELTLNSEEEYFGGIHARLELKGESRGGPSGSGSQTPRLVISSGVQTPVGGPVSAASSIRHLISLNESLQQQSFDLSTPPARSSRAAPPQNAESSASAASSRSTSSISLPLLSNNPFLNYTGSNDSSTTSVSNTATTATGAADTSSGSSTTPKSANHQRLADLRSGNA